MRATIGCCSVLSAWMGTLAMGLEVTPGTLGWPQQGRVRAESLVILSPEALLALYRGSSPVMPPCGWVRGQALVRPGERLAPVLSRGARAVWQGKEFRDDGRAINRFFGCRMIEGEVSMGPSWYDGQPAVILDYERTSRVYGNYRDEVRQVSPGLFLGLMYDRTTAPPRLVRLFALESP